VDYREATAPKTQHCFIFMPLQSLSLYQGQLPLCFTNFDCENQCDINRSVYLEMDRANDLNVSMDQPNEPETTNQPGIINHPDQPSAPTNSTYNPSSSPANSPVRKHCNKSISSRIGLKKYIFLKEKYTGSSTKKGPHDCLIYLVWSCYAMIVSGSGLHWDLINQ